MSIVSSQLETWATPGAVVSAQATHTLIRNALSSYKWPVGVTYDDYLQGSYRNHTNIRGDSDVDLVVELTSVFWSNLTAQEKQELGLTPAQYSWGDFRSEVIGALTDYYGASSVDRSGSKSIKVLASSDRLPADVVVAGQYRYYENLRVRAYGIVFWTNPDRSMIVNYPKVHFDNGAAKNSNDCTSGWFKPTVRAFKNARNRIEASDTSLAGKFPSYLIECLLYNVPDSRYGGGHQRNFVDVLNWLNEALYGEQAASFTTQSGMEYLFGDSVTQWNLADARLLTSELIRLWNEW